MALSSRIRRLKLEIDEPQVPKQIKEIADSLKQAAASRTWEEGTSDSDKKGRK